MESEMRLPAFDVLLSGVAAEERLRDRREKEADPATADWRNNWHHLRDLDWIVDNPAQTRAMVTAMRNEIMKLREQKNRIVHALRSAAAYDAEPSLINFVNGILNPESSASEAR